MKFLADESVEKEESSNKIMLVKKVLAMVKNKLKGYFVVVNEIGIRIKKISLDF